MNADRHYTLEELYAERDKLRKLAGIRERILTGGEDFAAIAAVTSQDPGSAADGGDLVRIALQRKMHRPDRRRPGSRT